MKLGFNEAYKRWRNRARRYSLLSIVDRALGVLHAQSPGRLEEIRKAPWQVLLLVKWACQDQMLPLNKGERISTEVFDDLRQDIWSFPEQIEHGISKERPVYLFLRQLLRPQVDFQRRLTLGFMREAALLASQPNNSRLRRTFEVRAGLPIEAFIDLSFATYAAVLNEKLILRASWFDPLRSSYGSSVNAFIDLVSRDVSQLTAFFRGLPDAKEKHASELFEFPLLKRFPFLRVNSDLVCWHPVVFFRGMESMVHSIMSETGAAYIEDFSKLFERHVVAEARQMPGSRFYSEKELKEWVPAGHKVTDSLLSYTNANVYIEAKAGMFDESVLVSGHSQIFRSQTASLQGAIRQASSCASGLRLGGLAPEQVRGAKGEYLLVVTNKELSAGRGDRFGSMMGNGFEMSSEQASLPLTNIYFLSIADFERLVHSLQDTNKTLPEFLDWCIERDNSPQTSVFYFEQHLDAAGISQRLSELVNRAIASSEDRLRIALPE